MKLLSAEEREKILKWANETFGIPESVFENLALFETGREIWVANRETLKINLSQVLRRGIRFCRKTKKGYRLVSTGVLTFGAYATKGVVEIDKDAAEKFVRGEDLKVTPNIETMPKQIIVRFKGTPLGSGIVTPKGIKNQVPVAKRIRVPIGTKEEK